jgi:hypothetical protein
MDEWRDHIPEGQSERFERFDSLGDVFKTYLETDTEIGRRVRIPNEDSSPEDVARFYSKLGRPESPDGYQPQDTEDQGLKELMDNFLGSAHKANLTTGQFDALQESLVQTYADLAEKGHQALASAAQAQRDQWVSQAKESLGDEFDAVVGQAREAVNRLLTDEQREALRETGLTDNPHLVEMFGRTIYPMIADGKVPSEKAASEAADGKRTSHVKAYREAEAAALKLQSEDKQQRSPELRALLHKMSQHRLALAEMGIHQVPDLEPDELI